MLKKNQLTLLKFKMKMAKYMTKAFNQMVVSVQQHLSSDLLNLRDLEILIEVLKMRNNKNNNCTLTLLPKADCYLKLSPY